MKLSTELFDLIKSLSKSEKRYFKLHTSLQGGDKNYIKLFHEIDAQNIYDEQEIKNKFKNEKFVKQLTFTKNYLYRLIMKSLQAFHSEKSIDSKLCDLIQNCKLLYARALYREFFSGIKAGKKLAEKYERFNYYLQLIEMEKVVFLKKVIKYKDEKEILKQEQIAKDMSANYNAYSNLIIETVNYFRLNGRIRDNSLNNFVNRVMKNEIMSSPGKAICMLSKEAYYRELTYLADLKGDFEEMNKLCLKRLEIIQANPEPFEDRIFNYIADVLMYLILINVRLKKYKEAGKYILLADKYFKAGKFDEANYFMIKNYGSLILQFNQRNYKKAAELVPKIIGSLKTRNKKFDNNFRILIWFTIVKVLLLNDQTEEALELNNNLLNDDIIKVRQDVKYYAELVNILIHYELKNFTLVKHLINSTLRYLERNKRPYKMENILLGFIKKLPSFKTEEEKIDKLIDIKRELDILRNDKYEKNVFDYFPFDEWVEKQIKKK